jgi:GAF domain-containing protein
MSFDELTAAPENNRIDDPARLDALRETGLLDTPPEKAFDRLTRLVTTILHVPISMVSLVDDTRQFFKSCVGLPEPTASQRQTPLTYSFCKHVVTTGRMLVVSDARQHPDLRDNLAVPLGVIAYAGIPLVTPAGFVLGSFCAIDNKPHYWSADELEILVSLAYSAMTEIVLRVALRQLREHGIEWPGNSEGRA